MNAARAAAPEPAVTPTATAHRPPSHAQHRMWLVQQFQPDGVYYNLGFTMRLEGPVDVPALRAAFVSAVGRHDSLRSRFVEVDGEPFRIVADTWSSFAHDHLTGDEPAATATREWTTRWLSQPYELESGPLFRVRLLTVDERQHVLGVFCHHIVADGHSMDTIMGDVFALYTVAVSGGEARLPAGAGYDRYVAHEARRLSDSQRADLIAYWRHRLAGAPTDIGLAFDRTGGTAVTAPVTVTPPVAERVHGFARDERASLFMVCLAAYAVVTAAMAGRDDVIIGTPVDLRSEEELEGVVGLCVNTVPVRIRVPATASFRDLVRTVRAAQFDDLDHADLPLDLIVNDLRPQRRAGRHALVQATFQLDPSAFDGITHGPLTVRPFSSETVADPRFPPTARTRVGADFILQCHLYAGKRLSGFVRLAADDVAVAHDVARLFEQVLEAAVTRPDVPVGQMRLALPPGVRSLTTADERVEGTAPPPADVVHRLTRIWSGLLHTAPRRTDDFFTLGGHSMLASRLASRLRSEFGRSVTVADVFSASRLDQQAAMLLDRPPLGPAGTHPQAVTRHPMSRVQQAFWRLEAEDGDDLVLWMPTLLEITGAVADRLETALRDVAAQHTVLRSRVVDAGGEPVVTQDDHPVRVYRATVTTEDPMGAAGEALRCVPPADPAGPLALYVIAQTPTSVVLLLLMHATIWDAASRAVFLSALASAYAGTPFTVSGSYPAYAADEAGWLAQPAQADRLDTLIRELVGVAATGVRREVAADEIARRELMLGRDRTDALRACARGARTTPTVVLLAACSGMFGSVTSTDRVVVRTPTSMRHTLVPADTIGPLTNKVLAVLPRPAPGTGPRLADVKAAVIDAMSYVDIPFDAVRAALSAAGVEPATAMAASFIMHEPWVDTVDCGDTHMRVVRGATALATEDDVPVDWLHVDVWALDDDYRVVFSGAAGQLEDLMAIFERDLGAVLAAGTDS